MLVVIIPTVDKQRSYLSAYLLLAILPVLVQRRERFVVNKNKIVNHNTSFVHCSVSVYSIVNLHCIHLTTHRRKCVDYSYTFIYIEFIYEAEKYRCSSHECFVVVYPIYRSLPYPDFPNILLRHHSSSFSTPLHYLPNYLTSNQRVASS